MTENKWVLSRAGLFNFWYYDRQIFEFADGKLLLRGSNGSGKSVTMQSLFPVLLDGKSEPSRLDSFGSSARRMEDYLLGEEEVAPTHGQNKTGYLFLEYKNKATNEFLTTGIGLSAKRNDRLHKWYFAITDGTRVELDDFNLLEKIGEDTYQPLSKQRLKNKLENRGYFFEKRRDYAEFVNNRIFGYESLEQFEELIKLLISLRSPKLSKDFRPTTMYEILTNSLPPLKEADLQPLAQTIEEIDHYKEQIERLRIEEKAIEDILAAFDPYRAEKVGQIAENWLEKLNLVQKCEQDYQQANQQQQQAQVQKEQLTIEKANLETRLTVIEAAVNNLQEKDGFALANEEHDLREKLAQLQQEQERLQEKLTTKTNEVNQNQEKIDQLVAEDSENNKKQTKLWEKLKNYAADFSFADQMPDLINDFDSDTETDDVFSYWNQLLQEQRSFWLKLKELIAEKEKINQNCQQAEKILAQAEQTRDQILNQVQVQEQLTNTEREAFLENVHSWYQQFKQVLPENIFEQILQNLAGLYEQFSSLSLALNPLYEARISFEQQINEQIRPIDNSIFTLNEQKQNYQQEITKWQNQLDPQTPRTLSQEQFRSNLPNAYPFYATVDFKDHVDQKLRNNLEAALLNSGLLDAIVATSDLKLENDVQLKPSPTKPSSANLTQFLRVEASLPFELQEQIQQILQSIGVVREFDQAHSHYFYCFDYQGNFTTPMLRGETGTTTYQASFIGQKSRAEYRLRKIAELQEQLTELNEQLTQKETQKEQLLQKIAEFQQANAEFPSDQKLLAQTQNEQQERANLATCSEKVKLFLANYQQEQNNLQQSQLAIKTFAPNFHGSKDDLTTATNSLDKFSYSFNDLFLNLKQAHEKENYLIEKNEQQQRLNEEQEQFSQEIAQKKEQVEQQQGFLAENLKRQEYANLAELKQHLQELVAEKQDNKNRQKELDTKLIKIEVDHERLNQQLEQLAVQKINFQEMEQLWKTTFAVESKRFSNASNNHDQSNEDLSSLAKKVKRKKDSEKLGKLANSFDKVFMSEEGRLLENRVQRINENSFNFSEDSLADESNLINSDEFNYWQEMNQQKLFVLEINGKLATPYAVLAEIKERLQKTEYLMNSDEENLYQQIIVDSVGNILRNLITKAQKWVKQMDQLLKNQGSENSSGLTLSLHWLPKPADSTQELSTSVLVKLLKKDAASLTESDLQQIRTHFEEKINLAKELRETNEQEESLFITLRDILDYRKWFDFQLEFKRGGQENFRDLTNNQFLKFSGGEKAISMYLPLFVAVYSRYQDAASSAPYLITLDEAFAGIDEQNIAQLFAAIEALDFNYVMNSQALYGEYDTVKSLNTYEILRPKNAPYVETLFYHWNGTKRELVVHH